MKKKISVYYYLRINNEIVVDLSQIPGLDGMEDYLKLNFFTGNFEDREELISALRKMKIISEDLVVRDIAIVKRKGNKKTGYSYDYITDNLIYKKDVKFLSINAVRNFLIDHREEGDMISEIAQYYRDNLEKLKHYKEETADYLKKSMEYVQDADRKRELEIEYQKIQNTLRKFYAEEDILYTIINLAGTMSHGEFLTRDEMADYINCIQRFVDTEVYYFNNGKRTSNNRGLVKLAKLISRMKDKYCLGLDLRDKSHLYEADRISYRVSNGMSSQLSNSLEVSNHDEDEKIDPDKYMFLEEDDYRRLLKDTSSQDVIDSVEDGIESLKKIQGGTAKK